MGGSLKSTFFNFYYCSMMKRIIFVLVMLFISCINVSYGQRFVDPVFSGVDSIPDVAYGTALNYKKKKEVLQLDFYEPRGDSATQRPLVIFAHGGGFTSGTRKWPSIKIMCEKLAQRGFAVASISYRIDPRFNLLESDTDRKTMTDAMFDMKAAIRFFKQNRAIYRIDTSQIFISGESAGAITAMMAGYVDKTEELKSYPKAYPQTVQPSGVSGVLCLCGMMTDTSAIDAPDNAPLLWVHGSSDPLIPFSWAYPIVEQAENKGLSFQKIVFEEATHCPWYYGLPNWQLYMDSVVNYMAHFMYPVVTGNKIEYKKKRAALQVADAIQSNMVIQQDKPFQLWGSAEAGDTIEVKADWLHTPATAYAGADGAWSIAIAVPVAVAEDFTPHSISISNRYEAISLSNLLIGEVWLCAGQSNMDMRIQEIKGWYDGVPNFEQEIAAAEFPEIRIYTASAGFDVQPRSNLGGTWQICSPQTAGNFSAVAYYFGRQLYQQLKVPIGLVVVAAPGASSQAFTPKEVLLQDTLLKRMYWDPYESMLRSQALVDSLDFFTKVTKPALIYNAMLHPLQNLSLRGFIWYQGESNYADGDHYTRLCSAMLQSWRNSFGRGDLPFYFVQIAPYSKNMHACPNILGLFWEAQQGLLSSKHTGMALSMDLGETENIHPRNKKPIGVRLAKLALNRTYGLDTIMDAGPVFSQFKIKKKGLVEITFADATIGTGLTTRDGKSPQCFFVAGDNQIFYPATARIRGNKVVVFSKSVPKPIAVRYGFANNTITNLENKKGLPAFPFRTDKWDCSNQSN